MVSIWLTAVNKYSSCGTMSYILLWFTVLSKRHKLSFHILIMNLWMNLKKKCGVGFSLALRMQRLAKLQTTLKTRRANWDLVCTRRMAGLSEARDNQTSCCDRDEEKKKGAAGSQEREREKVKLCIDPREVVGYLQLQNCIYYIWFVVKPKYSLHRATGAQCHVRVLTKNKK